MVAWSACIERSAVLSDLRRCMAQYDVREWLHADEMATLAALANPVRRETWLAGRWLAKLLIIRQAAGHGKHFAPAEVLISSRDHAGRHVRPVVRIAGIEFPGSLSISHGSALVVAALAPEGGISVGIDVVDRPPVSRGWIIPWCTASERAWIDRAAEPRTAATIWSAKEAVYKACNRGEQFVPAQIEISRDGGRVFGCMRPYDPCEVRIVRRVEFVIAIALAEQSCVAMAA